jgi:hypothetical protein
MPPHRKNLRCPAFLTVSNHDLKRIIGFYYRVPKVRSVSNYPISMAELP